MPSGIYIQIPFCQSKCTYCHFASGVFPRDLIAPYVHAVSTEIIRHTEFLAQPQLALPPGAPDTIYLGGGTPSLLEAEQLAEILTSVRTAFPAATAWREVTIEADPETVVAEKAKAWNAAGVTRASLGAQSFCDDELRGAG